MSSQLGQSTILAGRPLKLILGYAQTLARKLGGTQLVIENITTDYVKEVRKIYGYTRGVQTKPLAIIIDADSLFKSPEAQNAFLKVFEEPNPNVYLLLCTTNAQQLLPTIRSRAHLIQLDRTEELDPAATNSWLDITPYERLKAVAKIKHRDEALELVQDLARTLPQQTTTQQQASNLTLLADTLDHLTQNGNIKAQLTNLAINLAK